MPGRIFKVVLLCFCTAMGGLGGLLWNDGTAWFLTLTSLSGIGAGAILLAFLRVLSRADTWQMIGGGGGAILGTVLGILVSIGVGPLLKHWNLADFFQASTVLTCLFMGTGIGAQRGKELAGAFSPGSMSKTVTGILDTSVIIDGRIADICETGFIAGDLVIPQFVLKELQMIADSGEATKRTRGRRGLDILNKIRKQSYVDIVIDDSDYPSIREVDQKLITLAKEKGLPILTNDFNLNKVAEVHSIHVLNINRLANALKPIVLPGENMRVPILKEGKEPGQGVAYLDDGTMVVVENGKRCTGKTVEVVVTSVLQTTAGRMIFAAIK
ncbi:MAG: PIN domain-containing protein [Thermodesulfobacteriota bacterium]